MDSATLQAKVYGGYAKAAARVGPVYTQYRPKTPIKAISTWNKVGVLNAAFTNANQSGFQFNKPNDFKNIEWSGLFDASNSKPGDYLLNETQGTYYIAALQHLLPPLCIECSRVFSVLRENTSAQVGAVGFGGVSPANQETIVSEFPGGMQWTREGAHPVADLPSDLIRKGGWLIFLPLIPGVTIKERDVITDDLSRRFLAMSVYLSDLGYRIQVEMLASI